MIHWRFLLNSVKNEMGWISKARNLPLAFAQVREDALLDDAIVNRLGENISVLMIGSGGCTAALIATNPRIRKIRIADINYSQIALCQLKIKLLENCDTKERLQILGHSSLTSEKRYTIISKYLKALGYSDEVFGPIDLLGQHGPDHLGRYEFLFSALRNHLGDNLLLLRKFVDQGQPLDKSSFDVMKDSFREVMAMPHLIALFGEEATQNAVLPFSDHFFKQTQEILRNKELDISRNPYFYQMMFGEFPDGHVYPWMEQISPNQLPELTYFHGSMIEALEMYEETYQFIHLSNILDWLNEEQASKVLSLVGNRLAKGGIVFIRQLNSNLSIPGLSVDLSWDSSFAGNLLKRDRSFFYPKLHVGIKI